MNEYVVVNIKELTDAIVEVTRKYGNARPWWRGQADIEWNLTSSLYRNGFAAKENNLNAQFRLMAKSRYSNCPSSSDAFGWLFLMQHYRLPTRLLDWSDSPLIALYFAIESEKHDDVDAVLWALSPTRLNSHQSQIAKIFMPGSKDIRPLGIEAFISNKAQPDERILAVFTEQFDIRHMVQQSAFTVHGCGTPINRIQGSDTFLSRIRIPKAAKPGFRQILKLLGISRHTLFPDLENLAIELSSTEFAQEIIEATRPIENLD